MIDPEATDFELLYYVSERDSDEALSLQAFEILCQRHYANLLIACQKSLGALTRGRPVDGVPVKEAACELTNIVLADVYDGLAKKFNRAPVPGTETRAVRAWLSRIARNYAHRQLAMAAKRKAGLAGIAQKRELSEAADAPEVSDLLELPAVKSANPGDVLSSPCRRAAILAAWEGLSEDEQRVLKLSMEYNAGWNLGGHATRENSRILCNLLDTTPAALRQRRKRALDKLRDEAEKFNLETDHVRP